MLNMSENYHLRKCFLQTDQVPTQSAIKKYMSPALASVYFNSMSPKLKVIAGLEPPMKGGGDTWYIPPKSLLQEGRVVMKPLQVKHMAKLNYLGVDEYGMKIVQVHRDRMNADRERMLNEWDRNCKYHVELLTRQEWTDCSAAAARENTNIIKNAFREFVALYTTSTTKIQDTLFEAMIEKIKSYRESTFHSGEKRYKHLLRQQGTMLYDRYTEKLNTEKARLKDLFMHNLGITRTALNEKLHDVNVEKHVAIEKLRQYLECQNLACQVYVALIEREECSKNIDISKKAHKRKVKVLTDAITVKDFKIKHAEQKEKKREEFNTIWLKKVCHVVKKFQMFVSYCLRTLPEHADFFINMEKLMLLQLNESLANSQAESIFEFDVEQFHTPEPEPHPFYLFRDQRKKPDFERNLLPKKYPSSASQMPVIVVNKRCIYSACDNFEQFTDKVKDYIEGKRGDDADLEDDHDYTYTAPVKYTPSQQLKELKLESSLLQVLQKEIVNLKQVPTVCKGCNVASCFRCDSCSDEINQIMEQPSARIDKQASLPRVYSRGNVLTRRDVLDHEREPKAESYMRYVETKKCECSKMAKKHLMEHLPPYMRKMSSYEAPELLNYEPCSVTTLKKLVKKARGIKKPAQPLPSPPSKTRDITTQISDREFEYLCTCFSDESDFIKNLTCSSGVNPSTNRLFKVIDNSVSSYYLTQDSKDFATERAKSLLNLVDQSPAIIEIFNKKNCKFDS